MPFFVSKIGGHLVYDDKGGYETRNPSTFWCIQKADEIYQWPDFPALEISTGDYEESDNEYSYSKRNGYHCLVPDFNFHAWPQVGIDDYEETVQEIVRAGCMDAIENRVGWMGSLNAIRLRWMMMQIGIAHPNLFAMKDVKWKKEPGLVALQSPQYLSLPDLVSRFSVLVDIEGNGYSGRLKYLLWSRRPVLLVDRPHKEYFFQDLQPWQHYVPVHRDLSDLVQKAEWCLANQEEAKQIAENAYLFSQTNLTRTACFEQWNRIISNHIVIKSSQG